MTKNILNKLREEVKVIPTEEYAPKDKKTNSIRVNLSLNINPFGISPNVMDKLKNLDESKIRYYYTENSRLINLIAEYVKVEPENILIGDGCDGCLDLVAKTFISKGDKVIIPIPTFHRYEFHTKLMGGVPVFVPMPDFRFLAKDVLQLLQEDSFKAIFLCNPNNPTGLAIDKSEILSILDNFDGIVIVDEALADITKVNGSELIKKYNNLIIVRSFSKSFGLASLRIGYMVAHPELIAQVKKVSSPFRVNGVAQELAIEALKDKEHINRSVKFLNDEREYLISELTRLGIKCTQSKTTNILVNVEKIDNNASKVVSQLKEEGILVTNASFFKVPEEKYIRIAVSSKAENRLFIEILKEKFIK